MAGEPRLRVELVGLNYAPEPTGIAPYTTGIARFLSLAGHEVHAIVGMPHYPSWRRSADYRGRRLLERDGGVHITRVWHPVPTRADGSARIGMEAYFAAQAASVPARWVPDVVLSVSPSLLSVGAALRRARRSGAAVGVVVQDLYGLAVTEAELLGGRAARSVAALESALLRRADGVVAIHDSFRRSLRGLGVEDRRITTIRNWSHIGDVPGDVADLRRRFGWGSDEVIVLHAGNMGAKQGLETVVEAAALADRRGSQVRFVLLGDGHRRQVLEQAARGLGRVQFLDPLPAGLFETALAAADVLLLHERPGVAEMCVPSKLTSYFTAGRPVVAATSPDGAAASEVHASGGGICILPGDPALLLDAVTAVAADTTESLTMGLRGQLFARDVLHTEAARSAYVAWVEGLAGVHDGVPTQDGPQVVTARRGLRGLRPRRAAEPIGRSVAEPFAGDPS